MRRSSLLLLVVLVLSGCGSDEQGSTGTARTPKGPASAELRSELARATAVRPGDFPKAAGRPIQEIADALGAAGPQLAFATPTPRTGQRERLAFGIVDGEGGGFVYAPTVLYVARGDGPARGPFAAPADLLVTDGPFRSRTAASEDDPFAAIYDARVPFDRPGTYRILAASKVEGQLVGSGGEVVVSDAATDPVPAVGEPAPRVQTETVASAGGDLKAIETRVPPDSQHETDLRDVLGKKPVALLFATPALCASRVCGPVVDVAEQLKRDYGDRVTFIHQEVYAGNRTENGLRAPLKAFNLPTEPWLFTLDRRGRIAARLEGSFGFRGFEAALQAALR